MSADLSEDERAALRAYLQRSEVRLSTIHRTATSLLSGAGVLVLLPALGRDAIVNVLRTFITTDRGLVHVALAVSIVAALAMVMAVIWLLLEEVTRFFFHSNHLVNERGISFTPRFTLAAIRVPDDELGELGAPAIAGRRTDLENVELLVPANARARQQIDARIVSYDIVEPNTALDDVQRAEHLFQLAGGRRLDLIDEAARVEFGMVRHVLRVQVVVLRYIKALLVVMLATFLMFTLAAIAAESPQVNPGAESWTTVVMLVWAPLVLAATTSPVKWLGHLLKADGAAGSRILRDRELTRVERVVAIFSLIVFVPAFLSMIGLVSTADGVNGKPGLLIVALVALLVESRLLVSSALPGWRAFTARR